MESTQVLSNSLKTSWFAKRCRDVVFSTFSKLSSGRLEVFENGKSYVFGDNAPSNHEQRLDAKIIIHHADVYIAMVQRGSIGAAEAFIEQQWTTPDLTQVIRLMAREQKSLDQLEKKSSWLNRVKEFLLHARNRNSVTGSKKNIMAHYDLGNELYTRFLDPQMMYSAAIYPHQEASLAEAQSHKLEMICQRLELKPSDHLLEIGSGWGGLAIYAAKNYGCKVTTTTISEEQFDYAQAQIKKQGLENKITLLKKDYRLLTGLYDKVVSVEMIEAVGKQYMKSFFEQCNERLKPGGKLLIQAITIADQRFEHYSRNVDFIQRYIFPGGFLPSIHFMSEHIKENTHMVIESLHDIGIDYARTLAHWRDAFLDAWPEIKPHGFDEKFKRLWLYYFGYCEGAFLERAISTVHLVARK
ncbi:class I SAM-dependent methyltransferase [Thalassotalea ganghwensis]